MSLDDKIVRRDNNISGAESTDVNVLHIINIENLLKTLVVRLITAF